MHKHAEKAHRLIHRTGYKTGAKAHSDEAQDRKMIAEAVHKHERHDHPGKPLTKLATGGAIEGKKAGGRLDKMARGGRAHKKPHTKITIVNAPQSSAPPAMGMPPRPAMPVSTPPGIAPAPMGLPMRKSGGAVPKMKAGAGSGEGRLEKAEEYGGKKHKLR